MTKPKSFNTTNALNKLTIYERNYINLSRLIPDLFALKQGDALKSRVEGFMDLNLDILDINREYLLIALSHYYLDDYSHDMIADPDMEIRVFRSEHAEALTYQDQYRYDSVYLDDARFNPILKLSLNNFLNEWLQNCLSQGHLLIRK